MQTLFVHTVARWCTYLRNGEAETLTDVRISTSDSARAFNGLANSLVRFRSWRRYGPSVVAGLALHDEGVLVEDVHDDADWLPTTRTDQCGLIQCPKCQDVSGILVVHSLTVMTIKCANCAHTWAAELPNLPVEIQEKVHAVLKDR